MSCLSDHNYKPLNPLPLAPVLCHSCFMFIVIVVTGLDHSGKVRCPIGGIDCSSSPLLQAAQSLSLFMCCLLNPFLNTIAYVQQRIFTWFDNIWYISVHDFCHISQDGENYEPNYKWCKWTRWGNSYWVSGKEAGCYHQKTCITHVYYTPYGSN